MPVMNDRRIPLGDQLTHKIIERRALATDDDRSRVEDLRRQAMGSEKPFTIATMMTSPMAAIFFLEFNNFNRGWDPSHSFRIGNIMASGGWDPLNPQGYALYKDDGDVSDGSHRLGAQAVTGVDIEVFVCLGTSKGSAGKIDCGKRRTAADLATLIYRIPNAKEKTELLTSTWGYEKSVGIPLPVNTADFDAVAAQVKQHDDMLTRAIEIGQISIIDAIDPLLTEKYAAKVALLLLRGHWPEARAVERLDELQTADFGEKDPQEYARKFIEGLRPDSETISKQREVGPVIKGMLLVESGQQINQKRQNEIKNAVKSPPSPQYPAAPLVTRDAAE